MSPGRALQIRKFLTEDEMLLFKLQHPTSEVFLLINENYQSLHILSDGQRATAMLLILMVQKKRLLMVDQPEDDLNNRFFCEDIVRILREQKGGRQLIAATHNPNIPVLGHAELIVALEASEERVNVRAQGAIDRPEVQEFVRRAMEGGEGAFRRRAQKYGWE